VWLAYVPNRSHTHTPYGTLELYNSVSRRYLTPTYQYSLCADDSTTAISTQEQTKGDDTQIYVATAGGGLKNNRIDHKCEEKGENMEEEEEYPWCCKQSVSWRSVCLGGINTVIQYACNRNFRTG
jgi:hypothetical protein